MRSAYSVSLSKCQPAPRQALAWLLALGCLIASPLASAEATIKVAGTGSATPLLETLGKAYERKTPRVRVEVVRQVESDGSLVSEIVACHSVYHVSSLNEYAYAHVCHHSDVVFLGPIWSLDGY
jgi:ABC-type molybdate transport system substrate-binding protein